MVGETGYPTSDGLEWLALELQHRPLQTFQIWRNLAPLCELKDLPGRMVYGISYTRCPAPCPRIKSVLLIL